MAKVTTSFFLALCFSCVPRAFGPNESRVDATAGRPANVREVIDIDNTAGGQIRVSLDSGASWKTVGKVVVPYDARVKWAPTHDESRRIPYYNLIKGKSNVMVVDPIVIHLRIDNLDDPRDPFGLDIFPLSDGIDGPVDKKTQSRSIVTDIAPGTSIFSGRMSPDIGSPVFIGTENSEGITSKNMHRLNDTNDNHLRILVPQSEYQIRSVEFENKRGGAVTLTNIDGSKSKIAEMHTPIIGTGRYTASAFCQTRGAVISQGVAHLQVCVSPVLARGIVPILDHNAQSFDQNRAAEIKDKIAGFEVTMVDHFKRDEPKDLLYIFGLITSKGSLGNGRDGDTEPVLEGAAPLFWGTSFMGEGFRTQFSFSDEPQVWYEIGDAHAKGKFAPAEDLMGISSKAFQNVAAFRIVK